MTYFLGFSGPPRSGKDSIARHLAAMIEDRHGVQPQLLACSTPMREVVYAMLGTEYSETHYEKHKDIPQETLGGKSIRQAMIALSEEHVKPTYGHAFWGKSLLGRRWDPAPKVLFVTDCGFPSEGDVFETEFGRDQCVWAQIIRKDCDFSNDSRHYVGKPGRSTAIINDGSVEDAAEKLYNRLLHQFEWYLS